MELLQRYLQELQILPVSVLQLMRPLHLVSLRRFQMVLLILPYLPFLQVLLLPVHPLPSLSLLYLQYLCSLSYLLLCLRPDPLHPCPPSHHRNLQQQHLCIPLPVRTLHPILPDGLNPVLLQVSGAPDRIQLFS